MDQENYFEGVFFFTNATDEDYSHLWNNKEYIFPKQTMCPMVIPTETLESIQEIRKRFAYDLAVREYYKTKEYVKNSKMGNGLPPLFDEKVLQPWIDQCLSPLPKAMIKVKEGKKTKEKFKASKAVGDKDNLAYEFKDDAPKVLGAQPDRVTS